MNIYEIEFNDDIEISNIKININNRVNINNFNILCFHYNKPTYDNTIVKETNYKLKYKINDNPLKIIMKNIRIPRYEDVYLEYLLTNSKILNGNYKLTSNNYSKKSSYIYKFKNIKIISHQIEDCNRIDISFHRTKKYYLHIMIDKSFLPTIYIVCINYYKKIIKIKLNKILLEIAKEYVINYCKNNYVQNICLLNNHKSYYLNKL